MKSMKLTQMDQEIEGYLALPNSPGPGVLGVLLNL